MNKLVTNIVFTKNRPLQLHAYLESLYRYFPRELFQTYILYKPELFGEEYERLFRVFPLCTIVRETDFHGDVLNILAGIETRYILFGIDDVVFFDSVAFDVIDETFKNSAEDIFGFSLRLGRELVDRAREPIREDTCSGRTVFAVNWAKSHTHNVNYPFELCATVYPTSLVRTIIGSVMNNNPAIKRLFAPRSLLIRLLGGSKFARSVLKSFGYFFSPNTFESWNCRWCQRNCDCVPNYLYFEKPCASAVQVNMVNVTTDNTFDGSGEHTVQALAESYRRGYRLDIDFVAARRPPGPHCGRECFRLMKS
jgi:hypothetical protein